MNPVDKIREQRKQNMLNVMAARPHKRRIVPLDQLRSIGLIASNLSNEDEIVFEQFVRAMQNRGLMVRKIVLPQFCDDLIDKYGFPKSEFSLLFTSYNYDLLIDTTPTNDIFGLYITLNANSNLRVCYHDTTVPMQRLVENTYDLIIRGEGPILLQQYLTQVLNYLTKIRK